MDAPLGSCVVSPSASFASPRLSPFAFRLFVLPMVLLHALPHQRCSLASTSPTARPSGKSTSAAILSAHSLPNHPANIFTAGSRSRCHASCASCALAVSRTDSTRSPRRASPRFPRVSSPSPDSNGLSSDQRRPVNPWAACEPELPPRRSRLARACQQKPPVVGRIGSERGRRG